MTTAVRDTCPHCGVDRNVLRESIRDAQEPLAKDPDLSIALTLLSNCRHCHRAVTILERRCMYCGGFLGLIDGRGTIGVSHGICPTCEARA